MVNIPAKKKCRQSVRPPDPPATGQDIQHIFFATDLWRGNNLHRIFGDAAWRVKPPLQVLASRFGQFMELNMVNHPTKLVIIYAPFCWHLPTIKSLHSGKTIVAVFDMNHFEDNEVCIFWKRIRWKFPASYLTRVTPRKSNSSPLRNGGWKTSLSYCISETFQGRTLKVREGTRWAPTSYKWS